MSRASLPTVAIVGCTGAVGVELIALIQERRLPVGELRLVASSRSAGREMDVGGTRTAVRALAAGVFDGVDLAFFSAGGDVSRRWAPVAAEAGATVIDNSSAFRMDPGCPLVVPEINPQALHGWPGSGVIANPNCSTIIALMAVTPLHRRAGIRRMVVSTYQAASGAGAAVMEELERQASDHVAQRPYRTDVIGRQYLFNVFSHDSPIGADGYCQEERKMVEETHKIWADDSVAITATCVRVPVLRAHCESINLTFARPMGEAEVRAVLADAPGVSLVDDRANNKFPEPIDASGRDEILIGRIRADLSQPTDHGVNLFVAGDQLRKGAALNAVQIAECLYPAPAMTIDQRKAETSATAASASTPRSH